MLPKFAGPRRRRLDECDPGMKRPPDRRDGTVPLSSVVGVTQAERGMLAHREYIVYREAQALPQYAIWCRHKEGCRCTHCKP